MTVVVALVLAFIAGGFTTAWVLVLVTLLRAGGAK